MMHGMRQVLIFILLICLVGCGDRVAIEDVTLTLSLGLDIDKKGNLLVYQRSPVFSREAKKKTEEYGLRAWTIRQSRNEFDAVVTNLTQGGKIQSLIIGRRLLQHKEIFPYLDALYRDAKNATNIRVIATDGPVHDVISLEPTDKPRLSIHLTHLIDTAARRHITPKVTLRQFYYMVYEKGMTPFVSEIRREKKEVRVTGTALLDKNGYYRTSLNLRESMLLDLLRSSKHGSYSLTIPVVFPDGTGKTTKKNVSFSVRDVKQNIQTAYQQGKFKFTINMKTNVSMTERTFHWDMAKGKKEMEQIIEKELNKQFSTLIKKMQRHQVDPIGLGLYARAYHYNEWKIVKHDWPAAFSKASVQFASHVEIKNIGTIN
ncbi:Ger(x)C family spore germination protein [Aneurinibacillus sp. BA2021]|nr:Ger(x)C family spore germination protein [Aneurinibacillus sp. BA2021]